MITEQPLYLELPLRRAVVYAPDAGAKWVEAMPHVLAAFPQITPDMWWNLTVTEAMFLVDSLEDD